MQTLALRAARYQGDMGVTWAEAEDLVKKKTGKELVRQSISPRFPELVDLGFIERRLDPNGKEYARLGKCGVNQIINWITPAGLAILKVMGI